jgi:hypothetical protein
MYVVLDTNKTDHKADTGNDKLAEYLRKKLEIYQSKKQ